MMKHREVVATDCQSDGKQLQRSRYLIALPGLSCHQWLVAIIAALIPLLTQPARSLAQTTICPTDLPRAIDQVVNQPQFNRARWGILVQTQAKNSNDRRTLYSREAQKFFTPASTTKLLTTAAALQHLGADYRVRTSIYGTANPNGAHTLWFVGRGDPTLTDQSLQQLVQQLAQKGVRQVDQLIVDDRYFRGSGISPTWGWDDVQVGYGAPASSLILNENTIGLTLIPQNLGQPLAVEWQNPADAKHWRVKNETLTVETSQPEFLEINQDFKQPIVHLRGQLWVGATPAPVGLAIMEPSPYFQRHLLQAFNREQIRVGRLVAASNPLPDNQPELATLISPPLKTLIASTNQPSNNLYAEVLLRWLGAAIPSRQDTLTMGLARLDTTLTQLMVDLQGYELVDGSGLSRHNLISPEAIVQTLQAMAGGNNAEIYRSSLAQPGQNGTLLSRFPDSALQNRLQAKTGTLQGVSALAGYIQPPNYSPLVFSIFVNHTDQPTVTLRTAIDQIVLRLADLKRC